MTTRGDWKRLGELLEERRLKLGYESREEFADETGVASSRFLFDLENAKRTNFTRGMLLGVEDAYEWERGSIQLVLDGGEPIPVEKARGIIVHDRRAPTVPQLRRDIRRSVGRLTEVQQLIRVRDFLAGLIDED